MGWRKTEYMRGDICRPGEWLRWSGRGRGRASGVREVRVSRARPSGERGRLWRNVFAAAVAGGVRRVVFTSSVAAYGFEHRDAGQLNEEMPAVGSDRMRYSAQKAELEDDTSGDRRGTPVGAYVLRPCIVAGPDSLELVTRLPYVWAAGDARRSRGGCWARSGPARCCPTSGCRCSSYTLTTGGRVARRGAGQRRAGGLQPRRARSDHRERPRIRSGLASSPPAQSGRSTRSPNLRPGSRSPASGWTGSTRYGHRC